MSKLFIVEGNQTKVLDQQAFDNEKLLQTSAVPVLDLLSFVIF